jgi:flagellin
MARINSNIASVIAQANLDRTQRELQTRLERLSTGLRINRGRDDPAGLIISERLRSAIQGADQGIKNSERANSVISTAESGLGEINDLLNSIRSLIVEAANSGANSKEEREANQLQIDSAIDSITRISNTTTFGGLRLLNGSLDYKLSGLRTSAIAIARVSNASFLEANALQIDVDVIASAQTGGVYFRGSSSAPGVIQSSMTLEVRGPNGVEVITIASGQQLDKVVQSINNLTQQTGVKAKLINNNRNSGMVFQSEGYGAEAFVSVKRVNAPVTGNSWQTFKFTDSAQVPAGAPWGNPALVSGDYDEGRDVQALVNGNLAKGTGLVVGVNSGPLGMKLDLNESFAIRPAAAASTFYITGGGAQFQLGPVVNALQQSNIGIQSVAATTLGATLVKGKIEYLSSLKSGQGNDISTSFQARDFSGASSILESAIDEISILRGRLGAFGRNVLDPNIRALQSSFENLTASESQIRDADFARETSKLTRAQILSSAGISTLSLANQQSQSVLQLLG